MLHTQNCLENHTKNAKQQNFFYSQPSTLPNGSPAKFYLSTAFGLSSMISSVRPTRSPTVYAYFITKIGNCNLKVKAMSPLVDTIWKFDPGVNHFIGLFRKLISPIGLYRSEIWLSFSNYQLKKLSKGPSILSSLLIGNQIETVQVKFLKLVSGLERNCATLAVLGEVGKFPIA